MVNNLKISIFERLDYAITHSKSLSQTIELIKTEYNIDSEYFTAIYNEWVNSKIYRK